MIVNAIVTEREIRHGVYASTTSRQAFTNLHVMTSFLQPQHPELIAKLTVNMTHVIIINQKSSLYVQSFLSLYLFA